MPRLSRREPVAHGAGSAILIGSISVLALTLAICAIAITPHVIRFVDSTSASASDISTGLRSKTLPQITTDLDSVTQSISRTADSVDKMRTQVDRLVIIASGTATNLEQATRSLKSQEDTQAKYWGDTAANVTRLTTDADLTIHDLRPAIGNLNTTLASLNTDLTALPPIEKNLNLALEGISPILIETNATMAHTAAVTNDMQKLADHYTAELLSPVKKAKVVALFIWNSALRVVGGAL